MSTAQCGRRRGGVVHAVKMSCSQGDRKETLALFGAPYAVNLVRAAMFNAAIRWMPIEFD
jgi:hypothetical protein